MLVCVPEPVCHTDNGNSSSCLPARTSSAARWIACAFSASSRPSSRFALAAAFLTLASAWTTGSGMRSLEIRKKRRLRSVWAPHSRSAGTSIGPKLSFSVRVPLIAAFILLLQKAAQHPRVLFVDIHALRQQIQSRLIVRFLRHRQHRPCRADHRLLRLNEELHHLLGLRDAVGFLDAAEL